MRYQKAGRVVFVRHGQSIWNITDPELGLTARFTGWVDVDLTEKGRLQAVASGKCLKTFGIKPNAIYTSLLKRSIISLNEMNIVPSLYAEGRDVTVIHSWRLNERHYGMLTGMSKATAGKELGEEKVTQWRRSWDQAPPPLHHEDYMDLRTAISAQPQTIITSKQRRIVATEKFMKVPQTESLQDCAKRVLPLWNYGIAPRVSRGETVLVVAHANSIRSLLKCIEGNSITDTSIRNISIPSAIPLVYDFVSTEENGEQNLIVDEIPNPHDQHYLDAEEALLNANKNPSRYSTKLRPLGTPSKLGVRGQYIANKELVKLHLGVDLNELSKSTSSSSSISHVSENFYDLVGTSFRELVNYSDYGDGKKDALIITDGKGVILHSNDAWTLLCGFTREDVIGKTNAVLQGPLTSGEDIKRIDEKLFTGLPTKGNVINYRKSGIPFVNDFTVIPVYDWINQAPENSNQESISSPVTSSSTSFAQHSTKPSYFVSKLSVTADRFDLPPLTPEQLKERNMKHINPEKKENITPRQARKEDIQSNTVESVQQLNA